VAIGVVGIVIDVVLRLAERHLRRNWARVAQ